MIEIPVRNGRPAGWSAFTLALIIGAVIQFGALVFFHPTLVSSSPPHESPAIVHYSDDPILRQEAMSSDPQSLYKINDADLVAPAFPALRRLDPYDLQPKDGDVRAGLTSLSTSAANTPTSADALKPQQFEPLDTIGTTAKTVTPLPARGAQLRISRWQMGAGGDAADNVKTITWDPDLAPLGGEVRWGEARFLLVFTTSGLSGLPQIQTSSGAANVDDDLRQKLADYFRQHPYSPGSYTVEIGP
jgi:hypothetical protein